MFKKRFSVVLAFICALSVSISSFAAHEENTESVEVKEVELSKEMEDDYEEIEMLVVEEVIEQEGSEGETALAESRDMFENVEITEEDHDHKEGDGDEEFGDDKEEDDEDSNGKTEDEKSSILVNRNRSPTSSNLSDFLLDVFISADTDKNGNYIIDPRSNYEINLLFSEGEMLQFDDADVLFYEFPEDIRVADVGVTTFDIRVTDEEGTTFVYGNSFEVKDNQLRVWFNQEDESYERLKAMPNVSFGIVVGASFSESLSEIFFNSNIVKEFVFEEKPDPSIVEPETPISIWKSKDGNPIETSENIYELMWVLRVNEDHGTYVSGQTIVDYIHRDSLPYMYFIDEGITVVVTFENGKKENRFIPWTDLDIAENDKGIIRWEYTLPSNDGKASYYISYKSEIDVRDIPSDKIKLRNKAYIDKYQAEESVTVSVIGSEALTIDKKAIGTTDKESSWEITLVVPSKGVDDLWIVDELPRLSHNGREYIDSVIEDSFEVEGLLDYESYMFTTTYSQKNFVFSFYKSHEQNDDNLGVNPTLDGKSRTIVIRYKTAVNQDWLNIADNDGYSDKNLFRHKNIAYVRAGSYKSPNAEASVIPIKAEREYIDKILLQRPNADNGFVAEFKVMINKNAKDLDTNADTFVIKDVLSSNLRFIPDSLSIMPNVSTIAVSHDDETNTLTFTNVPDETALEITYKAKVIGSGGATYSNTVIFGNYEKKVESYVYIYSSGAGTGSNPSITLVKRDSEDLSLVLSGAEFQLFYYEGDVMVPVKDSYGNDVTFTTGKDGSVLIVGNLQKLGWTLWANRTYCLVETKAPDGYQLESTPVSFVLTRNPKNMKEYEITGDQISVKNTRKEVVEEPEKPGNPEKPDNSDKPEKPGNPEKPDNSNKPESPGGNVNQDPGTESPNDNQQLPAVAGATREVVSDGSGDTKNTKVAGARNANTEDGSSLLLEIVLLAIAGIMLVLIIESKRNDSGGGPI